MIENKVKELKKLKLSELEVFQKNYKDLKKSNYEKLKKNIMKNGFIMPFFVWFNDNKYNIIDGTQRFVTLNRMQKEGIDIPLEYECLVIEANSYDDALTYIQTYSSQYGTINKKGAKELFDSFSFNIENIQDIITLDFGLKDLKIEEPVDKYEDFYDEIKETNFKEYVFFKTKDKYGIPELLPNMIDELPVKLYNHYEKFDAKEYYLVMFNNLSYREKNMFNNNCVGFFLDDFKFEDVYKKKDIWVQKFLDLKVRSLLTPNFSIWYDEPLVLQILAWYKTQYCGRYWQEAGIKVIPTLNWGDASSYEFCFSGVPYGVPTACIQMTTIGNENEKKSFLEGLFEAKKKINFEKILIYGVSNKKQEFLIKNIPKNIKYDIMAPRTFRKKGGTLND